MSAASPVTSPGTKDAIRFVFRNPTGLTTDKLKLIEHKLTAEKIDVFAAAETYLSESFAESRNLIPDYKGYHRQRDHGEGQRRGGVSIFISEKAGWKHSEVHRTAVGSEVEGITVVMKSSDGTQEIYVTCIYISPYAKEVTKEDIMAALPFLEKQDKRKWVVVGDFNAHHEEWDSLLEEDTRGRILHEAVEELGLLVQNDADMPTRSQRYANEIRHSSPDVAMTRNVDTHSWRTEQDGLSDHNWMHFVTGGVTTGLSTKRRFWVKEKIKLDKFQEVLGREIEKMRERKTEKSLDAWTDALHKAMRASVPKGSHPDRVPLWTVKMEEAHKKWKDADAAHRKTPTAENLRACHSAYLDMREIHAKERARKLLEEYQDKEESKEVFKLIKNMTPQPHVSRNQIIKDATGNQLVTDRQKAEAFVKRFAKVSSRRGPVPEKVKVHEAGMREPLTMGEMMMSYRKMAKNRAVGDDEIPVEVIDWMTPEQRKALLRAMNDSYLRGDVPLVWRRGVIIPLLKPLKPASDLASYRPVTLTSQLSKLMERMIARRILYSIRDKLESTQWGFRDGRSTVDALMEVVDKIVRAFDTFERYRMPITEAQKASGKVHPEGKWNDTYHRALTIMVDFSSAFDTIGHHAVLRQLEDLGANAYDRRWVRSFLTGREAKVRLDDDTSRWTPFESGVPQGTVLGPLLFIVALNDLLKSLREQGVTTAVFADDLTLVLTDLKLDECIAKAQIAMDTIEQWTKTSCMEVNVKKTFGMVFSKSTNPSPHDDFSRKLTYGGKEIEIHRQIKTTEKREGEQACAVAIHATKDFGPIVGNGEGIPQSVMKEVASFLEVYQTPMSLEQSRLLGLHFDRRLLFFRQVQKVRKGTAKAKQAMAFLCGATNGAWRKDLCKFHVIFSRSRELYGVEVYWDLLSAEGQKDMLSMDREGIRQAVGTNRGASEASLLYESDLAPLDAVIEGRKAMYYERTIRLGGIQTERAERPAPENEGKGEYYRTPMDCCRERAEAILKWGGIRPDMVKRVPIVLSSPLPPWALGDEPLEIYPKLAPGRRKEDIPKLEQRDLVVEAVKNRLTNATIHFWTDGSSHVERQMSGAAAVVYRRVKKDSGPAPTDAPCLGLRAGTCGCPLPGNANDRSVEVPAKSDKKKATTEKAAVEKTTAEKSANENNTAGTVSIRSAFVGIVNSIIQSEAVNRATRRNNSAPNRGKEPILKTQSKGSVSALISEEVGSWEKILRKKKGCGPLACSFTTEGEALEMALKEITEMLEGHDGAEEIVGFVDCGSLLGALQSGMDQDDPVMINIIRYIIKLRERHRVVLQHVYSHCGVRESDEVDVMADEAAKEDAAARKKMLKGGPVVIAFRDMRALVRQWVKEQTRKRVAQFLVHPKYVRKEVEDSWPREDQVIAAQIRTGEVRFLAEWARRFDRRMAESCRFCCPHDHTPEGSQRAGRCNHQAGAPRGCNDPVRCIGCNKLFDGRNSVARHRRHLRSSAGKVCKEKGAKEFTLRGDRRTGEDKQKKKDIPRRESTPGAQKETVHHVLFECKEAKKVWGGHDGTLKGMVEFIKKIKRYFDEIREKDLRTLREKRLQKQYVDGRRPPEATLGAPDEAQRSEPDRTGGTHTGRGRHGRLRAGGAPEGGPGRSTSGDGDAHPARTTAAKRARPPARRPALRHPPST